MPRSLVPILALFLCSSTAPLKGQGFRLGGGLNLSDFMGGDAGTVDRKSGLDLGASIPIVRVGALQLRAEGYYRQKGARGVEDFQQAAISGEPVEIGIDYVEAPLLLRATLPSLGRRIFPYLEGGPAFAWRVDCGISYDATGGSSNPSCDDLNGENLEQTLKDYEQGLVFGGGIDVPVMSFGSVNVDARYTHGLSRLAENGDVHNRAFSVMLGYSFGVPHGFGGTGGLQPGVLR